MGSARVREGQIPTRVQSSRAKSLVSREGRVRGSRIYGGFRERERETERDRGSACKWLDVDLLAQVCRAPSRGAPRVQIAAATEAARATRRRSLALVAKAAVPGTLARATAETGTAEAAVRWRRTRASIRGL